MRVRNLNIGVESISRWQVEDEVHLPKETGLRPAFLPLYRPLDEILRRPSLDERLPGLLQPELLDPDLLEPATLTDVRHQTREIFAGKARRETGRRKHLFEMAASCLDDEINLDQEVRRSLAALLRG
jgi:hypothetical protein